MLTRFMCWLFKPRTVPADAIVFFVGFYFGCIASILVLS